MDKLSFFRTKRDSSGRPPTCLKLQLFLQQVTYRNVSTLHADTRNSVLHSEIHIHSFPENSYQQVEVLPIGFWPKLVFPFYCLWASCIPWKLSVIGRFMVQVYGPSEHMTH